MATERVRPASFLKHAADVASFYGFQPMREIDKTLRTAGVQGVIERQGRGIFSFQSSSSLCGTYANWRPQEPVLAFYATPSPSHPPYFPDMSPRDIGEFGLHVVGSGESVGEIVLLKTLTMILNEWGVPVSKIRVNALGDKDSQQRFLREISLFVRKHAARLEEEKRAAILENPLLLYRDGSDIHKEIALEGPRPMHFLSEKSRVHFRSILEHLENLGLPYELDDSLVGDERGQHVTFAIDHDGSDATVLTSVGGRYDEYLKREARHKNSVGVSASIFFRRKGTTQSSFSCQVTVRKPKVYFAQLGTRAKLQGLSVLDMLRTANVPVMQSFDASRFSSQLATAHAQGVSHLLIIGQREALDGTIIVRSMKNSSQITVQLSEIPRFLKTLRV